MLHNAPDDDAEVGWDDVKWWVANGKAKAAEEARRHV